MAEQSEIFARYRSLYSSKSVNATVNEAKSRLDNLDFVDFLFELVKATKGQKQFKNIVLKGSLSKLRDADEINNTIKNALINQFGCDNTLVIPTRYTTKSSLGIDMDKSEVDAYGLLGIDPEGLPGKFLYEGNNPNQHVNFLLYKAQGVSTKNPIEIKFEDRVLFQIYAKTPNTFNFKFGEYYEDKTFAEWLSDYLTLTTPIFNTVNFTTVLTDIITGAISISANKNKVEIRKENSIIKALQKIFGFCSDNSDDNSGSPDSSANSVLKNVSQQTTNFSDIFNTDNANTNTSNPFDFNFEDLNEIEDNTELKTNGRVRFKTCGNLDLGINPNDIINQLELLFQNANQNDIYSYDGLDDIAIPKTNQQETEFDNSSVEPNLDKVSDFFDETLRNSANSAINSGETNIIIDLPAMNAELQLNILKAIPYALMQIVLTPKILMIPKLNNVLIGDLGKKSVNDFIISATPTISVIGEKITSLLIKNIFDAIKTDLIRLAKDLAVNFVKQRSVDYLATLKSLLGLLNLFPLNTGNSCSSVLGELLRLLKLSNFGPMPSIPSPLILAGVIKPGMNSVAIFNDIKSNLIEKGIETAPTLPDGTPNNMMIAIEETVKTLVTHIKTNSKIQTFALSPAGPVSGYAQIQ